MTETALAELLAADLSGLDLVALMIDGVHFAESCCVVALGIDIDGIKHPLALVEGSTENATLVTDLLVDLRERGLDVTRPMLVGLDGSKALRKAVLDVLDHPVIQRCQLHKIRNVKDHLPQRLRSTVGPQDDRRLPRRLGAGGRGGAAGPGRRTRPHPPRRGGQPARGPGRDADGAAPRRSAHAGPHAALDERIESMISVCREHAGNVKRWRDGQMALRWCAAGMVEAGKQFRRVNGHLHLPTLRAALEREVAETVVPVVHNDRGERSLMLTGPPPKFHGTRDILGSPRTLRQPGQPLLGLLTWRKMRRYWGHARVYLVVHFWGGKQRSAYQGRRRAI